jgi:hypothetical protein
MDQKKVALELIRLPIIDVTLFLADDSLVTGVSVILLTPVCDGRP